MLFDRLDAWSRTVITRRFAPVMAVVPVLSAAQRPLAALGGVETRSGMLLFPLILPGAA